MKFKYIIQSKVGLLREENEDSVGVFNIHDGLLVVVCDGLGGNNAGEVASKLAVDTIHQYIIEAFDKDIEQTVNSAIIFTSNAIRLKAAEDISLNGMSTTAEVLFIADGKVYTGHVGDSRIYLYTNKKLTQLTKDHSFVQRLVDEGVLTPGEAEVHPNRHIITRALGDINFVEVDLDVIQLEPDNETFLFACTDGVTGVIDNKELEEIFTLPDPENISQTISNLVEERGAPDNYSFVIVKVE